MFAGDICVPSEEGIHELCQDVGSDHWIYYISPYGEENGITIA
jgi:putative component of toxin-antitoxin plasmid stabilization module